MITVPYIGRGHTISCEECYMYDNGVRLKLDPAPDEPYQVEFPDGTNIIPENNTFRVPDTIFLTSGKHDIYIVSRSNENAFNTLQKIVIPVRWRPARGE